MDTVHPCPVCGWAAPRREVDPCPGCGLKYAREASVLEGELETGGDLVFLGLAWGFAILCTIGLGAAWLSGPLGLLMTAHLGHKALRGGGPHRLVLSDQGAGLVRRGRVSGFTRWHLFEEARLERRDGDDRWRLTLVNAYKPTISTYLHSRGTDAAIFAEAIEFNFNAPEREARPLVMQLRQRIREAGDRYSAIDLREMERIPPDPMRILHLHRCPQCNHELAHETRGARDDACPQCLRPIEPGAFPLAGRVVTGQPWLLVLALILGFWAAWLALIQLPWAAAVAGLGAALAAVTWSLPQHPRLFVVTDAGIESWPRRGPPRVFAWSELHACRAVQVLDDRWRLALWTEPKEHVSYSPLLFLWFTWPRGAPEVDVVLDGDDHAGAIVCEEVARRVGLPGIFMSSTPPRPGTT